MQHALRPYVTAGVALVGASMIAVTPVAAPPIDAQFRAVQLTDAWSDLFTETAANWQNILSHADFSAISQVFSQFLTNPFGVIEAFSNPTPTVVTDLSHVPGQITVELPPGLALGIANLGATGAELTALHDVAQQVMTNPSALFEGIATVLNAYLNGQDNISLLDGTITIPFFNGILAPLQPVDINLSLTNLVNAFGLGGLHLTNLDLSSLLSQLGLGNLTIGSLFSDLGLSNDGLGTLLHNGIGVNTLGGLLNLLGLNALNVGSLNLTSILSGLGLDTNVNLNALTLDQILTAFGINPTADVGLVGFLNGVGLSGLTSETLGSLLGTTDLDNIVNNIVNSLLGNATLSTLLTPVETLLKTVLDGAIAGDLNVTVGTLLGGQTLNDDLTSILTALNVAGAHVPATVSIADLLSALGFSSATGNLTLGGLLTDLGTVANPILGLNITDLLNGLDLGTLLKDLGLSNLPIDLTNLGDLSNLTLGALLGDLGLGDVASISVAPIGGAITELVDVVPQQILAALGI